MQTQAQSRSNSPQGPQLQALQAQVKQLENRNVQMASALAQADGDRRRLEIEREQAQHAAALFKELADRAGAKGQNPTNDFPTLRHVWAGWGRLGRVAAQFTKPDSELTEEEKAAKVEARAMVVEEMARLIRAENQLEKGTDSPDEGADFLLCALYGALNLDEWQFNQAHELLRRLRQEVKDRNPAPGETPSAASAPEEAMRVFRERAQAELAGILTPDQARLFERILPFVQMKPGTLSFNFSF